MESGNELLPLPCQAARRDIMQIRLSPDSIDDYRLFLRIKALPTYRLRGRTAWFPDEYAGRLHLSLIHI